MLEASVTQRLGDFTLDASLTVPAEGVTALFGRSGSGKSSLIRLIAGLGVPDSGIIRLGETWLVDTRRRHWMPPHRRRLGVVFQEARLFPHYSVRGNLRMACLAPHAGISMAWSSCWASSLAGAHPGAVVRRRGARVAIGVPCCRVRALLMDEPLTGLDGLASRAVADIRQLARDTGVPILRQSRYPRDRCAGRPRGLDRTGPGAGQRPGGRCSAVSIWDLGLDALAAPLTPVRRARRCL